MIHLLKSDYKLKAVLFFQQHHQIIWVSDVNCCFISDWESSLGEQRCRVWYRLWACVRTRRNVRILGFSCEAKSRENIWNSPKFLLWYYCRSHLVFLMVWPHDHNIFEDSNSVIWWPPAQGSTLTPSLTTLTHQYGNLHWCYTFYQVFHAILRIIISFFIVFIITINSQFSKTVDCQITSKSVKWPSMARVRVSHTLPLRW